MATVFLPDVGAYGMRKVTPGVFGDPVLEFPPPPLPWFAAGSSCRNCTDCVWQVVGRFMGKHYYRCWGCTIENKISSQRRKPLRKGSRERELFYYWLSVKPECNIHHRLTAKRLQRKKEISPCREPSRYNPLNSCSQDEQSIAGSSGWQHCLLHITVRPPVLLNWFYPKEKINALDLHGRR